MKEIYCDGSCLENPGFMGIGVFIPSTDTAVSLPLGEGTNQQAELLALIHALDHAEPGDVIFSDSRYALGMAGGWKAKANKDLVEQLRRQLAAHPGVSLKWVKGHAGNPPQERADQLANSAANVNERWAGAGLMQDDL